MRTLLGLLSAPLLSLVASFAQGYFLKDKTTSTDIDASLSQNLIFAIAKEHFSDQYQRLTEDLARGSLSEAEIGYAMSPAYFAMVSAPVRRGASPLKSYQPGFSSMKMCSPISRSSGSLKSPACAENFSLPFNL